MSRKDGTSEAREPRPEIRDLRAPRGTADVLPEEMRLIGKIESVARGLFELHGYGEIRTPTFEQTQLFVRSIGEATDIVEKEMYTFAGADGESFSLRPEGTASAVRAYVQAGMDKSGGFAKFYYIGPMFRRERPQAGRMREFYQIGVEALGSSDPCADAETIGLALEYFRLIGLDGCRLKLNSIGCATCRTAYREALRKALSPCTGRMCEDCRRRAEKNVLRVLDCKNERCREIIATLPPMRAHLDKECAEHFSAVLALLDAGGVPYTVDDLLVRGFDYYTRTVWEVANPALGARDAVCGGGRYDNLIADVGGAPAGAAGFSVGELPTLLALRAQGVEPPAPADVKVFLVAIDDTCRKDCFRLVMALRAQGVRAEMEYQARSPKAQMRSANKCGAAFAAFVGPDEIQRAVVRLKDMKTGEERAVPAADLAATLSHSDEDD